jgi:hypothetical protein
MPQGLDDEPEAEEDKPQGEDADERGASKPLRQLRPELCPEQDSHRERRRTAHSVRRIRV